MMIKYLLPIMLALTAPAAAQQPQQRCLTPDMILQAASSVGATLENKYVSLDEVRDIFYVFRLQNGTYTIIEFTEECFAHEWDGLSEDDVNSGMQERGLQKNVDNGA